MPNNEALIRNTPHQHSVPEPVFSPPASESMNLAFLPASHQDIDLLFHLNKDLIDTYEDLTIIDYPKVLHWVRRNLEANLPHFICVLCDGEPAAYYCLTDSDGKQELDSLFVLPEFQNRGIGTAILQKCQQESPSLFLYVFKRNYRAISLYQRLGFRITQEVGQTRCIMEYTP